MESRFTTERPVQPGGDNHKAVCGWKPEDYVADRTE